MDDEDIDEDSYMSEESSSSSHRHLKRPKPNEVVELDDDWSIKINIDKMVDELIYLILILISCKNNPNLPSFPDSTSLSSPTNPSHHSLLNNSSYIPKGTKHEKAQRILEEIDLGISSLEQSNLIIQAQAETSVQLLHKLR